MHQKSDKCQFKQFQETVTDANKKSLEEWDGKIANCKMGQRMADTLP
jgi:hypothetical protein